LVEWTWRRSTAGLAVDLLADDVGVSCVAGGFLDDRKQYRSKVACFPVAGHRCVRVADRGDDVAITLKALRQRRATALPGPMALLPTLLRIAPNTISKSVAKL